MLSYKSTKPDLSLNDAFISYGLTAEKLRAIAESNEHNQASRAGALALYWLNLSESNKSVAIKVNLDLPREKALYAELVNEINEKWLTKTLIMGVLLGSTDNDTNAVAFVTYLMERCNEGGGPRNELLELLTIWQERSTAPVNSKGALTKWLGYNFEPPLYTRQ